MPSSGASHIGDRIFKSLVPRVRSEIFARSLLPKGSRVLIAVSGGQDSLALAEILTSIQLAAMPWTCIGLAHTDHGWPGDVGCVDHVAKYAESRALPMHVAEADGKCQSQSEAAARAWRYAALRDIARAHQYSHVAVGHTQSDLAETLLFNLTHGAGADGLASLTWLRNMHGNTRQSTPRSTAITADNMIMLARPLLSVSRSETATVCAERNLDVWNDVYNSDPRYARFRTREHVLPYLRAHYNVHVEEALARTAHLLRDESIALEGYAAESYAKLVRIEEDGTPPRVRRVLICSKELQGLSIALQRRVMRRVLTEHTPASGKTPIFKQVEALLGLVGASDRSSIPSLPGAAIARLENGTITICMSLASKLRGNGAIQPTGCTFEGNRDTSRVSIPFECTSSCLDGASVSVEEDSCTRQMPWEESKGSTELEFMVAAAEMRSE